MTTIITMGKESGPPAAPPTSPPHSGRGEGEERGDLLYSRSLSESSYISVTALSPQCHDSGLDSPSGSNCSADSDCSDNDKRFYSPSPNSPSERDSANSSPSSPRFYYTEHNDGMFSITEAYIKHQREAAGLARGMLTDTEEEHMDITTEASNVSDTSDDITDYGQLDVLSATDPTGYDMHSRAMTSETSFRQMLTSVDHHQPESSEKLPLATNELHQCRWLQCSSRFVHLDDLVTHVNDAHVRAERDVDYKCYWSDCPRKGKGFNARYKMLIHVRTHTNEKPYKCDLCKKSFSRLENLKIHNRSHTGERPYICPFEGCNKAYSNSSDRFKHVRTHQEQKPYCCRMPGCDKRYTDPSSLRKHVKTHGHYFRQLPASKGGKLRHRLAVKGITSSAPSSPEPSVPLPAPTSASHLSAISPPHESESSSVLSPPLKEEASRAIGSSLGVPPPSVSYDSYPHHHLSLPTYIPSSHLPSSSTPSSSASSLPQTLPLATTTQPPYPGGEDFIPRPAAPLLCGRDEALKHSYEHSLLSHLSPHHLHHMPYLGGSPPPGLTLPMGNTLLTLSPSGIPTTLPTQVISIHGNMLHISSLGSEQHRSTAGSFLEAGPLSSAFPSSLPTHSPSVPPVKPPISVLSSHHPHHSPLHHPNPLLSLYSKLPEHLPTKESNQLEQVSPLHSKLHASDMPLDLSNPSDKNRPTYISSDKRPTYIDTDISPDKRPTYIDSDISTDKRPTYLNTHLLQSDYRSVLPHVITT